jgi:lipoprotein NlpD
VALTWNRLYRPAIVAVIGLLLAACSSTKVRQAPIVEPRAATATPSPVAPQPAPPAAANREAPNGLYTVQRGDTLKEIAAAHGRDMRDLARWNNLDDPNKLTVGQVLRVNPPIEGAVAAPIAPAGSAQARPLSPASPPQPPGSPPPTAAPSTPAAPQPSALAWAWPASGKVLVKFDEKLDEIRNKGIDIAAKEGDPVTAAADGVVLWIGNTMRGYGNLVILKHNEEFTSAYAHNSRVLVKKDQAVKRGDRIADAGKSDAATPRLHFEIRRSGRPVDPQQFLPTR